MVRISRINVFQLMIFAALYFIMATLIAMIVYDHYNIYTQFLSALGVGPTGILFNPAVVLLGISMTLFYIKLLSYIREWRDNDNITPLSFHLGRVIMGLAIITGIFLIGVGLFISDGKTSDIHDFFAVFYFLLLIPIHGLFPVILPRVSFKYKIIIQLFSLATSLATIAGFFAPGINQYIFQKIVVFFQLCFFIFMSLWLLSSD